MPFRLRRDTRTWFKHLYDAGAFALDFDMYYLCLMAGLATGRREDVSSDQTTELVDHFPGVYREKGRIIVALFLSRQLKEMHIKLTERATLHTEIQKLVDPLSSSHLSELGQREINRYSYGGFDVLTEWFDDKPRTLETFIPLYKMHLDEVLADEVASIAPPDPSATP